MAKKNSSAKQALSKQEASKALKMLSFAAVALALGLVAVNYFATSLNFHRQVFSKKSAVESQLQTNAESLTSLDQAYNALESSGPRPEEIFGAIPTSGDFPNTSVTLENIANRSGVEVRTVNLLNETGEVAVGKNAYSEANPIVKEMSLTLELGGSYSSIKDFVGRLQDSRRIFKVNSIEMSGTNRTVNTLLQITTYYAPAVDNSIEKEVFSL